MWKLLCNTSLIYSVFVMTMAKWMHFCVCFGAQNALWPCVRQLQQEMTCTSAGSCTCRCLIKLRRVTSASNIKLNWAVSWMCVKGRLTVCLLRVCVCKINVILVLCTVSHRSEYTPHIFVNIVLYLFMWQHWRNVTLLQCKVVSVQIV